MHGYQLHGLRVWYDSKFNSNCINFLFVQIHNYMIYAVFLRFLQIWRIKKRVCATLLSFEFSGATRADEAGETKSGSI